MASEYNPRDVVEQATYEVLSGRKSDKPVLLMDIVEMMLVEKGYSHDVIEQCKDCVLQREDKGSTGQEKGWAIPHACTPAVRGLHVGFFVVEDAIDFDSNDGKPVHFLMLILFPPGVFHITMLAHYAKMSRDKDFHQEVSQVITAEELRTAVVNVSDRLSK